MKSGKLIHLALIAVVMIGLAVWTSRRPRPGQSPSPGSGSPVLSSLQDVDRLNSIAEILIRPSTGEVWRFVREKEGWKAADRFGYPADFEKVSNFLLSLRRLKVGRRLPDDPASLGRFGLAPGEADGESREVTLKNAAGQEIALLRIGKEWYRTRAGGEESWGGGFPDGRYLWAEGRAVLVMDTLPDFPASRRDWLSTEVANVGSYEIRSIEVREADGRHLLLQRPDSTGALKLPDLAAEEEMESAKVNSLANLLSWLHFEDVADPASSDEALGFDRPTVVVMTLTNGVSYTVVVGGAKEGDGGSRYLRLTAAYVPPAAAEAKSEGSEQDEKAASEQEKAQKKLAEEVKAFNARHANWTYIVAAYKLEAVSADRAQFVKPKPPPAETAKDGTAETGETGGTTPAPAVEEAAPPAPEPAGQ